MKNVTFTTAQKIVGILIIAAFLTALIFSYFGILGFNTSQFTY